MPQDTFYKKPPVVETVMGVQFEPIPGFTNGHLGLFWAYLGGMAQWTNAQDAAPVGFEFERFGDEMQWEPLNFLRFGISQIPSARLQIRNATRDRMVQVQNGRLIYNWIGTEGSEYARYEKIRREFDVVLEQFQRFLSEHSLPTMSPNQWEITYINHLPKGTVWNSVGDWGKVFKFTASPPEVIPSCRLESIGSNWVYEIEPSRGRLHMKLQHGRTDKREDVLIFSLTARGPVREGEGSVQTVDAGLNIGHSVIVNGFTDLTSAEARAWWGQEKQ
jgi:uncharacterized protein (TIGR04255 family)